MVEGEKSMPSELNPTKPVRDLVEFGTPHIGEDDVGVCMAPPRRIGRGRVSSFSLDRGRNGIGEEVAGGVAGCRCCLWCTTSVTSEWAFILLLLVGGSDCGLADAAL